MNLPRGTLLRWLVVLPLAALALLPVADWIPGGYDAHVWWENLDEWWSGTLIAVGVGAVLTVLSRRSPDLWTEEGWSRKVAKAALLRPARSALFAACAAGLYAVVAQEIFGGGPTLIDELVQLWHGRLLATGHLWAPSVGHPELFGVTNLVDHDGKMFSQFPIGGPAMLALGSLIHAEWLVGPIFGALGVWWWSTTLRRTGEPEVSGTNALLLFALAPFAVFMAGSHMNHVPGLAWILGGMAALATLVASDAPRPLVALGCGLAFGLAGTIRPVDAMAFGAPAGAWLAWRAVQDRRRMLECVLVAVGMAIPLGLMLWANAATTGHPLRFGYSLLWGDDHGLGFHPAPWGMPHTPARGFELLNQYLLHFQVRFLETSFPSLIPALLVLAFWRRFTSFDRYLLASAALILGCYWAYWHNGFFLGPRFLFPLLPVAALLTGRLGTMLRERFGPAGLPVRFWTFSALVGTGLSLLLNVPLRAKQYGNAFVSWRWPVAESARAAGAENALVLVRESWGALVIERMWGLDVPRATAEFLYFRSDMCRMEETLGRLERSGIRGAAAVDSLRLLTADSMVVVDSVLSIDNTERMAPGTAYTPTCLARLAEDRAGFTVYPPLLADNATGNVYIHDQQARDTVALRLYPDRPIFVLAPDDTTLGAPPRFRPAGRDSLFRAWGVSPQWPAAVP